MKRVRVSELVPGMITAEDIYSFNNQLVVEKNTVLTDEIITRLEYHSVLSIRVVDEGSTGAVALPQTSEDLFADDKGFAGTPETMSYSERIKATKRFMEFQKTFTANTEALQGHLHDIIENNSINTGVMLQSVSSLISKGTTSIGVFDMLHNMRTYDDLTYVHSMSVSVICNIFGHWIGYGEEDIKNVTLAGLLHDIGKIAIPQNIVKKPSKLTNDEYKIIKQHTIEGYKILKNLPLDNRIKDAALLHHERFDGSGYPLSVTGDKVSEYAKIVAIADVYDAMTAARVYRGPMCPFKVISIFEEEGLQKYDSRLILVFLQNISQTYLNNRVRLNNGVEGDVVLIHNDCISRPLIKCLDGRFIDLSAPENKSLSIEELI